VRAKHAAGDDVAEPGKHLVQILDDVAHVEKAGAKIME